MRRYCFFLQSSTYDSSEPVCSAVSNTLQPHGNVACQSPLYMEFFFFFFFWVYMEFLRQEYWNGLPFLTPGDLSNLGIEPMSLVSPAWQADSLPLSHLGSLCVYIHIDILENLQILWKIYDILCLFQKFPQKSLRSENSH